MTAAEADALLAQEHAQLAANWAAYRRRHPDGTLRAFCLEQIEDGARELAELAGAPPELARILARNVRRRAEEHAP